MVFIRFLLAKSYGKLVIHKKQCIYNQVLICFLNMCEKYKIYIFLKWREYLYFFFQTNILLFCFRILRNVSLSGSIPSYIWNKTDLNTL